MNLAFGVPVIALSLALAVLPGRDESLRTTDPALDERSSVVADNADSGADRALLEQALLRVVPGDVGDVRFTEWHVLPIGPANETVLGKASLNAGGSAPLSVAFRANLDLERGDVLQLSYRMLDTSRSSPSAPAVDAVLRSRIGGELVAQFQDQPMDFRITAITGSTRTKTHLVVVGEGISDFFAEGRARTPFVATFAIPSAQLVKLDYDLVALPEAPAASLAIAPAVGR
jgi:hypothetical protein